jgi:hypothetical protein
VLAGLMAVAWELRLLREALRDIWELWQSHDTNWRQYQ